MDIEAWIQATNELWTAEPAQLRMRLEQLSFRLVRFLEAREDKQALSQLAAGLDRSLQKHRTQPDSLSTGLARGAITTFLCVISTFANSVHHRDKVALTIAEELLEQLASGPKRSGELADRLHRDRSQVSRALKTLVLAGSVIQLPGRMGSDGRGRLYALATQPQPKATQPNVRTGAEQSEQSRELALR